MMFSLKQSGLSTEQFHQLTNSHAGRESMWVHDHVGTNTLLIKRHVLLLHYEPCDTLLAVARAELVTQFGSPEWQFNSIKNLIYVDSTLLKKGIFLKRNFDFCYCE